MFVSCIPGLGKSNFLEGLIIIVELDTILGLRLTLVHFYRMHIHACWILTIVQHCLQFMMAMEV